MESARDNHLCLYGTSSNNSTINEFTARHLPLELRFTPVNSTSENSEPVKPKRTSNVFSSKCSGTTHQRSARNCRLIGFTPLIEEVFNSSEEDSIQFLGPRHVKAKEVAPCALFYKRADVFVSSEMKSQNVLALSESHYCKLQFDDEVSIRQLEYADQQSDHSREVAKPSMNFRDGSSKKSSREDRFGLKVNLEPSYAHREPVCQTFAKDGLTSMPLESSTQPGFQFDCKPFHIYAGETESPLTSISKAEQNFPWEAGFSNDLASDPEQSTSSIDSCGIQSNLWDSIIVSSSRATSPTSSIYSRISPSCHVQPVITSAVQDQLTESRCKLTKYSLLRLNAQQENKQKSPDQGLFDWWEDKGSLADDENDSSASSIQIKSDDD